MNLLLHSFRVAAREESINFNLIRYWFIQLEIYISHPKKSQTKSGQDITKEIYNLLKKYSAQGLDLDDEEGMMGDIEIKRQSWRYSKLSGLRFLDYLCKKNVDADKAVKELYLFGGSASDHSSIYYKYS